MSDVLSDARALQRFDVVRPDPAGTIRSLASLGYSAEAALADLVDNSIAAHASEVHIVCHWAGAERSWVVVADNGDGMTQERLVRAMTVGAGGDEVRSEVDLGRFGMGLKSASFSQAVVVSVASRVGGKAWSVRTWDTSHVVACGDWQLLHGWGKVDGSDLLETLEHRHPGLATVVLWRGLTRLAPAGSTAGDEWAQRDFYGHVNRIDRHLGMVFFRYLSRRRRLHLTLNHRQLEAWDPFMSGHDYVEELSPETPVPGVRVQGFVLPHRSRLTEQEYLDGGGPRGWLDQQGFYVYRRDRLIVAGDWLKVGDFRKDEKHVLARISVELPPEQDSDWALDVKKSTAMPPAALVGHLRRVAKATRERAGAVINHRGRVVRDRQTRSEDFTWHTVKQFGRTRFLVNRGHPLITDVVARQPSIRRDLNTIFDMIDATLPVGLIRATADVGEQVGVVDEELPDDVLASARRVLEALMNKGEDVAAAVLRVRHMPPFSEFPSIGDFLTGEPGDTEGGRYGA